MFGASILLLPFSVQITGSISEGRNSTLNDSTAAYSGSGDGYMTLTGDENATDYCGNDPEEDLVNENSIRRVPIYVWVLLALIMGVMVCGRYGY